MVNAQYISANFGVTPGFANQFTFSMQRKDPAGRPWPQHAYSPSTDVHMHDSNDEELEEGYFEEDGYGGRSHCYQQRPHHALASSGLCIPPAMAFAPLAKLNAQSTPSRSSTPGLSHPSTHAPPGSAFASPYVYSPRTVPTPPPSAAGFMHTQLRAPASVTPPGGSPHPGFHPNPQQHPSAPAGTASSRGEFMVLRTDRRTGSLHVAGTSQTTHSGAVQAMRQTGPDLSISEGADYRPRDVAALGTYVCSVSGCGKRYTFGSNLRRHVRTAHPDVAFQSRP